MLVRGGAPTRGGGIAGVYEEAIQCSELLGGFAADPTAPHVPTAAPWAFLQVPLGALSGERRRPGALDDKAEGGGRGGHPDRIRLAGRPRLHARAKC